MAATIPVQIGSDLWNARIYASLAAASELAAEVDRSENEPDQAVNAAEIREFLNRLNDSLARGLSLIDRIQVAPVDIPKEGIIAARNAFLDLYRMCDRILTLSKEIHQIGQMKAELELVRSQSERALDVADWLDALSTPNEIEEKFVAARAELEAGEVVPMAALR